MEVVPEAVKILRAAIAKSNRQAEFVDFDWGAERFLRDGTTLPADAVEMFQRDFDAILFGAVGDPRVPSNRHAADILLGLRAKLDLYVNARPVELLDASLTPLRDRGEDDIRFIIFRENTEGLYAGAGGQFRRGDPEEIAIQEDINTRRGVERIIRYAFEYARARKLGKVLMSDKSNALTFGHELWQRVFAEVRREYPEIEARHLYIDTLAAELVRDPSQFRVIVTCNLFGDIASDLAAQLAGGLGIAPSGNIHPGRVSLFEPVHGSAPNIAGKGIANPMGAVLAVRDALRSHRVGRSGGPAARRRARRGPRAVRRRATSAAHTRPAKSAIGSSNTSRRRSCQVLSFLTNRAGRIFREILRGQRRPSG